MASRLFSSLYLLSFLHKKTFSFQEADRTSFLAVVQTTPSPKLKVQKCRLGNWKIIEALIFITNIYLIFLPFNTTTVATNARATERGKLVKPLNFIVVSWIDWYRMKRQLLFLAILYCSFKNWPLKFAAYRQHLNKQDLIKNKSNTGSFMREWRQVGRFIRSRLTGKKVLYVILQWTPPFFISTTSFILN